VGVVSHSSSPVGGLPSKEAAEAPPYSSRTSASALLLSSPRLSYSSTMVLPWYDDCVLLGPYISLGMPSHPATQSSAVVATREGERAAAHSSLDGFRPQKAHILRTLRSCGIDVAEGHVMSCVSQVVPFFAAPSVVPFQAAVLHRGYAVELSTYHAAESGGGATGGSCSDEDARTSATPAVKTIPFLHVYGGNHALTRRIAEEAVDTLVSNTDAILAEKRASLMPCRTRQLQLETPSVLQRSNGHDKETRGTIEKVQQLIEETYAERLVDVVARRQHTLYTSPADAVHALPHLAVIMARMRGWDAERQQQELAAARAAVEAAAIWPLQ